MEKLKVSTRKKKSLPCIMPANLYLIRHDVKAWSNGRKPLAIVGAQHDCPLRNPTTPSAILQETIRQLTGQKFDYIYVSPFLRTRQTLQLLLAALPQLAQCEIIAEPRLGEYLGYQGRKYHQAHLTPTTSSYYPTIANLTNETLGQLRHRVQSFLTSLSPNTKILIISHGLTLHQICGLELSYGGLHIHHID